MNRDFIANKREKAVQRYISALDSGNLDDVFLVLEEATSDPVLDQMIIDVNQAIEQEEGLTPFAKDASLVQGLIQAHFAQPEILEDERQITVGDVAARMQADHKIPVPDQEIHKHLLKLSTPLPDTLNIQAIRKLAGSLQISASEKFWRVFRDTAIMLGIGRGQAHMAATRKQAKRKSSNRKDLGSNEDM